MNFIEIFFGKVVLPVVTVLSLFLLLAIPFALYYSFKHDARLMEECIADGHKEYECEGILTGNKGQIPIISPIIVK